jgi:hypothetical protein
MKKQIPLILAIIALVYMGIIVNNMPKENLGYPANCFIIQAYYLSGNTPIQIPNTKITLDKTVVYSDENGDALFCGMSSQTQSRPLTIEPPSGYSPSSKTDNIPGTWITGGVNYEFTQTISTTSTTSITTTTINNWQYNTCEQAGMKTQNSGVCTAKYMNNVAAGTYCYTDCENDNIPYKDLLLLVVAFIFGVFIYKMRKHKNQ